MKKISVAILLGVMVLSLGACGKQGNTTDTTQETEITQENESTQETETNQETEVQTSAVGILETLWGNYEEGEKFAIAGGDSANSVMDKPGSFDVANSEELDALLGFPEAQAGLIDDAASMVHMMNGNTFTCGVFHVADAENVTQVTDAVKDNIMNRQWMCGFPDTLIVAVVQDEYVVSAFGLADNMEVFKTKLLACEPTATIMYEESLSQ